MSSRICFAITLFAVGLISLPVWGQSQLPDSKKAVVAFDINLKKLRENKLVESLNLKESLDSINVDTDEFDIETVLRVFGSMSAPGDIADFSKIEEGGDMPLEFFVQVKFVDAAAAEAMMKEPMAKGRPLEKGGKTYYKLPEGEGPDNIMIHLFNETTVEMGTDTYLMQKSRRLFTESLEKTWSGIPKDDAVKIAVDFDGARELVDQGVDMMIDENPDAEMFAKLLKDVGALQLSMDLDSKTLINFVATGKDAESAERLKGGIDAGLGMAQFFGKQGVGEIPDDNMKKVAGAVLSALKATQQGNDITISIPKPDGFEAAVKKAAEMFGPGADQKSNEF